MPLTNVTKVQNWGHHHPPGIGVQFTAVENDLENKLFTLLKSDKIKDSDRQVN
jgi:hypothetical protein